MSTSALERLMGRVAEEGECWTFNGSDNGNGYQFISVDGRGVYAHRFAYEALVGPIPERQTIDHLCRNRACVNPKHLEVVTLEENGRRGSPYTGATHCVNGHLFAPWSTANRGRKQGGRECRVCASLRTGGRTGVSALEVRIFAAASGLPVKARGVLPQAAIDLWNDAHPARPFSRRAA